MAYLIKILKTKVEWKVIKSWLGIAAIGGAGLLPCPDCGAPMIFHFWPVALALTLLKLRKGNHSCKIENNTEDQMQR